MIKISHNCPICGRDERKAPCWHSDKEWQDWTKSQTMATVIVDVRDEREKAQVQSHYWLDQGDQFALLDPDGPECLVARSYLHALEKIKRLTDLIEKFPAKDAAALAEAFDRKRAELDDVWPEEPKS